MDCAGSHIDSDDWAAYGGIEKINHEIYCYGVIIHHQHFVDTAVCICMYLLRCPSLLVVITFNYIKRNVIGLRHLRNSNLFYVA